MPRLPRLNVPGGCYHVTLRGNHREDLFATAEDRYALNGLVAKVAEKYEARVHAFCWMTNHLHILIQIKDVTLGKPMQQIARRYARYRHKKLNTTGHLFERRYSAWLVDTDAYFVALLRYIHRNPVRAGIVTNVDDYPWSSHPSYCGAAGLSWVCTEFGLSLFGTTMERARHNYRVLIGQEGYASEERLLDEAHPDDPRVLGGDQFLSSLPFPRVIQRSGLTLDALIEQVCAKHAVTIEAVRSPAKHRCLSEVRAVIALRAQAERVATLVEVARWLGRSPNAIGQLLKRRSG